MIFNMNLKHFNNIIYSQKRIQRQTQNLFSVLFVIYESKQKQKNFTDNNSKKVNYELIYIIRNSSFLMIRKKQDWITYGKIKAKSIFFYQNKVIDLTHWNQFHENYKDLLAQFIFEDIKVSLDQLFHITEKRIILENFQIGRIPKSQVKKIKQETDNPKKNNHEKNNTQLKKNVKKVEFSKKIISLSDQFQNGRNRSKKVLKYTNRSLLKQNQQKEVEPSLKKSCIIEKKYQKQYKSRKQQIDSQTFLSFKYCLQQDKPILIIPKFQVKHKPQY